jgi:putative metallohydrolase (TIGR04338 family)
MSVEWYELPLSRWLEKSTVEEDMFSFRDSTRNKFYKTQTKFINALKDSSYGLRIFNSVEEMQEYADKILNSAWVRNKRFPGCRGYFKIVHRESKFCWIHYGCGEIYMAKWGWNEVILLHELAHAMLEGFFGPFHGRLFARLLAELIGWRLGPAEKKLLKQKYSKFGIKSNPIPVYSEETKARMRKRGKKLAAKYFKSEG